MNEDTSEYSATIPHMDKSCCRVCLQNGGTCNSFFDVVNCNGENKELRELYCGLVKIEVNYEDAKPTQICDTCTNNLLSAVEFILNAEKSEEFLTLYITQNNESPLRKSPFKPEEDLDLNLDIGEEEGGTEQVIDNETQYKEEIIEDTQNTIQRNDEKQCEEFEILDEFEFILAKETDSAEETTTEATEQSNKIQDTPKNVSTVRNSIGSRLSARCNGRLHRFSCPDCQRTFAKLQTFQRHVENAHTYAPREEIAAKQLTEPTIQCPNCPRSFMHKNDLQRHILAIHPDIKDEFTKDQNNGEPTKLKRKYNRGLCPHCGRDFPVASLNIHIRRHLGVNPYKCKECGKGFPRKQDLTVHERHHSGERPHLCTVCGKSFIRPNKLSRHMRIHLGIRPYKCEECGKCFSQSNDLKLHIRRHSGEKPYACGVCTESFISGTALRVHRRTNNHFEPDSNDPDPFINCRVNTRPLVNNS